MTDLPSSAINSRQEHIQSILNLLNTYKIDERHTFQVARFCLVLFDDLSSLHQLGEEEKFYLECGALLHDIGWPEGYKGHHKASLNVILTTKLLKFENKERLIIGSIARYHRKSEPDLKHDHFAALSESEQKVVTTLAAILRVADGLDRSHRNRINGFTTTINEKKIVLHCQSYAPAYMEEEAALKKAGLFEKVFDRKLEIKWK